MSLTDDIPDAFFHDLKFGYAVLLKCDPLDLIRPLMNESGLKAWAHNPFGNASGIFQAMPATLHNLGFPGTWEDFVKLDADQQLGWMYLYYRPYTGKLVNATAVYMATFCPAWLPHANEPDFVICGTTKTNPRLSDVQNGIWYAENKGFDHTGKGWICVQDLTDAITRADQGPRWLEIVSRLEAAT